LLCRGHRKDVATLLEDRIPQAVRREFPGLRWDPPLSAVRDIEPAALMTPDGLTVRMQLLNAADYASWPNEPRDLVQRYSDAPPATLLVPTSLSFAAWKTEAWIERAASRDLYDLWSLSKLGAINSGSARLFARYGSTGAPPSAQLLNRNQPTESAWRRDLANQTQIDVTAEDALSAVITAWHDAAPVRMAVDWARPLVAASAWPASPVGRALSIANLDVSSRSFTQNAV